MYSLALALSLASSTLNVNQYRVITRFSSDNLSINYNLSTKMIVDKHNLYHPFINTSFGLFINTSSTELNNIVDEIDLYYQPLLDPLVAIIFFLVKLLVILIGEIIGIKFLKTMKKETGLLKDITMLFVTWQMACHPILAFFDLINSLIYPAGDVIGSWFCTLGWFVWGYGVRLALYNSFITALMRYLFVVHEERVAAFGKEKIKKIFWYLSQLLPLFHILLKIAEGNSTLSFINKCYGYDHKIFLSESTTLNVLKNKFWKAEKSNINQALDVVFDVIMKIIKLLTSAIFLIMGFNLSEIFIYINIFSHLNR